ncbi:MAG: hypothetical protein U0L09_06065, partial [Christensenellales bacterium]|nr:hypothetical protein [Christensenellales bacterium]
MASERRIQGKKGGFRRGCSVEHLDDFELSRWMRMEAVKSTVNGRGRLALSGRELEKVRRLSRAAVETDNLCKDSGALLERLVQDRRMMEVCAERAHREGMAGLPAAGGSVRIGRIAEVLCGHGDIRLSKDRLMLGLASFNDVQSLEMSEWWSVPQALRWALCREWIEVAGRVVEQSKQRRKAEAWVQGRFVSLRRSEAAFFEHAFCLLGDMEDGKRFDLLERFLMRRRCCGEELISAAHEETARLHMRLDNILHNLQMMEALNWKTCFEMLSSVEAELNYDPSGIYPRMEDASKGSIRAQVASLAR